MMEKLKSHIDSVEKQLSLVAQSGDDVGVTAANSHAAENSDDTTEAALRILSLDSDKLSVEG